HDERGQWAQCLAEDSKRLTAGGEDAQTRTTTEEMLGEPRGRVHQVLAVVQDNQRFGGREGFDQTAHRLTCYWRRVWQTGLAETECADSRLDHGAGIGHWRQLDQPDPAGETISHV